MHVLLHLVGRNFSLTPIGMFFGPFSLTITPQKHSSNGPFPSAKQRDEHLFNTLKQVKARNLETLCFSFSLCICLCFIWFYSDWVCTAVMSNDVMTLFIWFTINKNHFITDKYITYK